MFLPLYVIISSIYVEKIHTFSVNYRNENTQSTELHIKNSYGSETLKNESVILTQKLIVQAVPNLTKAPNLKYNIFDKMLSNEMLSIKQHLFVKNSTYASSVYISLQNNVPTPTLELKQRWPIDKVVSNDNLKGHADDNESTPSSYLTIGPSRSSIAVDVDPGFDTDNKNEDYNAISKVIEVRGFSVMPDHYTKNLRLKPPCTCMKLNQDTTCTQHCTATGERPQTQNTCTHSDKYINFPAECTRNNLNNIMSFTPYPYVYPSYFLGVLTQPANMYYHPDVINELKVPKHKHRHTNKPFYNYQFFEDGDDIKEDNDDYLENDKVDFEEISAEKYKNKKKHKCNHKLHSDISNPGFIEVIEKEKFVDEVIEDLKAYYSDAVVKDCYCSSTFNLKIKKTYFITILLVIYIR